MNNELFELCKEVYKRKITWITGDWFLQDPDGKIVGKGRPAILQMDREWKNGWRTDVPLYTSDYLLEKLPESVEFGLENCWLEVSPRHMHGWLAQYKGNEHFIYDVSADTPLKALLELVIALDDAGEVK